MASRCPSRESVQVRANRFSKAVGVGRKRQFATRMSENSSPNFCVGMSNVSNLTWSCRASRISHPRNLLPDEYLSGRWSRSGFEGGHRLLPAGSQPLLIQKEDEAIASSSILRSVFSSVKRERPLPSKWRLHPVLRGPLRAGANAAGVAATVSSALADYPKSAGRSDPRNWGD